MPTRILIVEDDPDIAELMARYLDKAGFITERAASGRDALQAIGARQPALIVLDLMLPHVDGLEVCRLLRANETTAAIPIIMVTARADESERIVGLEMGADDYITKPFSPRELVARVKAILRRTAVQADPSDIVRHGDLSIDVSRHEVTVAGKPIALTATEFRILHFLATKPGRVLSRDDIIDAALGRDANVFDRTIDVHITAIRRKLGPTGAERIETIRGFGYKFRDTADATT